MRRPNLVHDELSHFYDELIRNARAVNASWRKYFDNWERDRIEALGARTRPIFGLLWTVDR